MDPSAKAAAARMKAFIDAHLEQPVTLQQLAAAAGYSPTHCIRIFREAFGQTPVAYLRAQRLDSAACELARTARSVTAIALDFEFGSHEGFTRAFARHFGKSPAAFRQRVKGANKMTAKTLTIFIQILDRPARKAIVKRAKTADEYWSYCQEAGCEMWEVLGSIPGALQEPSGMWLPAHLVPEGTSTYVAGVEVPADYAGPLPAGMELIELPPCRMMLFQGPPYDEDDMGDAIGAMWDAIDAYDPTAVGYAFAPELAPRQQYSPQGDRGYIELRPVREL